eukprot:15239619-Alexandrium_andersonii.AAC.1
MHQSGGSGGVAPSEAATSLLRGARGLWYEKYPGQVCFEDVLFHQRPGRNEGRLKSKPGGASKMLAANWH